MSTKAEVRERPILFSGPLVRAILDGRKTQTRRPLKPNRRKDGCQLVPELLQQMGAGSSCPYGQVGDVLWGRETWAYTDETINEQPGVVYRATDPDWESMEGFRWRPSIHMPKWASRLWLRITDVRVERLQSISDEDCKAEGVTPIYVADWGYSLEGYRDGFIAKWEEIYGVESWKANPWVWAISFERIDPPAAQKGALNSE